MDMESENMVFRGLNVKMLRNVGGHLVVPLENPSEWSHLDTVMFLKVDNDVCSPEKIRKIHVNTNHKSEENLLHAFKQANLLNDDVRSMIRKVCETCKICQKFKRSQSRPKVALPKAAAKAASFLNSSKQITGNYF